MAWVLNWTKDWFIPWATNFDSPGGDSIVNAILWEDGDVILWENGDYIQWEA